MDGNAYVFGLLEEMLDSGWTPAEPDLARLREPSALDKLSADERRECIALWDEVANVLKANGGGKP